MTRVTINGFGRMGRLALRALDAKKGLEVVAINEPIGSNETLALLTTQDSQQGTWKVDSYGDHQGLVLKGRPIRRFKETSPAKIPWAEVDSDIVIDCSGQFRTSELLQPHLDQGARRVVVSAPVPGVVEIVMGVNHEHPDLATAPISSAASCTTNALAPIVATLQEGLGIVHGMVTTLHAPTNTQSVHDQPLADPRRARSALVNLIPTSTNSAQAVTRVLPELAGKLDSIAVRVPVMNASIVDAVFEVARETTIEEVNQMLRAASESGPLKNILGYEERPLVSCDFAGDPRSSVVDALSTRVTDGKLIKVLAFYDNEWGYANRMVELVDRVAGFLESN
jgi:glyceraldehyde 3-phosphate dehydrogenase